MNSWCWTARLVALNFYYDGTVKQATVVLREPLQERTRYTVTVSQGVKDLIGNPMQADYSWSFRTGPEAGGAIYLPLVLKNHGP